MVALGSSQTVLHQAPCRRHWEDWAGAVLSGGGKHAVEKGVGRGECSGQCWLFTLEKLLEAHEKILLTSFSNSIHKKEEKVQQHFGEVASCYLHSVSFVPKTWG